MGDNLKIVEAGGHRYDNGSIYIGSWNNYGRPQGQGHILFQDGTRYDGNFKDGMFNGIGHLMFPDGAKYEGEFVDGWFHGCGTFWRSDGMKYEGEFRGGKIWGLGLVSFKDGTNGFPRHEGFFQECKLMRRKECPDVIQRAQKISFMSRNMAE